MADVTYTPTYDTWHDYPTEDTPINAEALSNMDTGIGAAVGQANTALSTATSAGTAASAAQDTADAALVKTENLSDLDDAETARTNLGLGTAALAASEDFDAAGTASAAVAALVADAPDALDTLKELADALGDDADFAATTTTAIAARLQKASNLSDVADAETARTNLGLGSAAVAAASDFDAAGAADAVQAKVDQVMGNVGVYVEDHGALGDGKPIADAAMTSGSPTLTSATADFTADDVGKVISVAGAGASGAELLSTISAFTDSTTVTLAANAGTTVTGKNAVYGTDDTAAINDAVTAAVAAAQTVFSNSYAEVRFLGKIYMIGGALVQGGTTLGNAQIPLPIIPMTDACVTLVFKGVGDVTALPIWLQTVPQRTGTTLVSTVAGTNHATFGEATVIGGPNAKQFGSSNTWNNMSIHIDGITISAPMNPQISGFDFILMAQAVIKSAAFLVNSGIPSIVRSTSTWQFGLRMPGTDNQSREIIEKFLAEGCCYGVMLGEHTVANALYLFYNVVAIQCITTIGMPHSCLIEYANCEGNSYVLQSDSGSNFHLVIENLDIENVSGYGTARFVADPSNRLRGEIRFSYPSTGGSSPIAFGSTEFEGAGSIRLIDLERIPGTVTAPTVPATATALRNTFWRDAVVYITGTSITDVKVDGVAVGLTGTLAGAMVTVPSGKNITLDYTGTAPTWVWTLL